MPLIQFAKKLLRPLSGEMPEGTQYGAIPFRVVEGQVVFLMITSRRHANWVFPKGSIEKGQSPGETAQQEAFEEAGVRGSLGGTPIGSYLHPRNNDNADLFRVVLFPLHVTEQFDMWPEEPERFRHWALLPQVRSLMASRQAARLAAGLNRQILSGAYMPGSSRISA